MNDKEKRGENSKAIILNDKDNIIIAIGNMKAGQYLIDFDLTIDAPILSGQKIAKVNIKENDPIYKYGTIIGFADSNIVKGQVLTNSNVVFKEFSREHQYCSKYKPTRFVNASSERSFMGFKRSDGRVGTRNFIAVVSTVNCSATVVHEIASYFNKNKLKNYPNVDGVAAFSHSTGCGMELSGEPMNLLHRTLGGYINHPNVAASLVVGLGCERCQVGGLFQHQGIFENSNLRTLVMQENGGTTATISKGIKCIEEMLEQANNMLATLYANNKIPSDICVCFTVNTYMNEGFINIPYLTFSHNSKRSFSDIFTILNKYMPPEIMEKVKLPQNKI